MMRTKNGNPPKRPKPSAGGHNVIEDDDEVLEDLTELSGSGAGRFPLEPQHVLSAPPETQEWADGQANDYTPRLTSRPLSEMRAVVVVASNGAIAAIKRLKTIGPK
jgi:hypothetical protein